MSDSPAHPLLGETQRALLVALARRALIARVRGAAPPRVPTESYPEAAGVFVTLTDAGHLRGCLGALECPDGLAAAVIRCAGDAATEDPRFSPVVGDEVGGLDVEVSVLGPLERIDPAQLDAIRIGEHGLVIERGHRRGLLLPQVATEWGWNVDEFLRHTCQKAGLPPDAWEHGATVYRFSADVFR